MRTTNHLFNFEQIDEITAGDDEFKKDLIEIFIAQIPEFLKNMNDSLESDNFELLARESHSAKSSVLIFGMENTGTLLKQIELKSKIQSLNGLSALVKEAERDLLSVMSQLKVIAESL